MYCTVTGIRIVFLVMKQKTKLNHYAMKNPLHLAALKSAFKKIEELKQSTQLSLALSNFCA